MLDAERVFQRVCEIFSDHFGPATEAITRETSLADDFGADDIDREEVIEEHRIEFHLIIPDTKGNVLLTVGDFVDYIMSYAPA